MKSSSVFTATLPYPPSVNHYWLRGQYGMYLSSKGRAYRRQVRAALKGAPCLTGDVAIAILAAPPDKRKRDLDNVLKALLDSLTHCGVWTDDSQVAELVIRRVEPCKPGHVMIMVDSLGDEYE